MFFSRLMSFGVAVACFFLTSCNGSAPIITCQSPCANSNETRDLFCVCQDYSHVGQPPVGPKPSAPYLAGQDVSGDVCFLQRHRWIFNPRNDIVDVLVGIKVRDGSALGVTKYYWYTVPARSETFATGHDLGLQYDGADCFDRDIFISTFRTHKSGSQSLASAEVSLVFAFDGKKALAEIPELDPSTEEYARILKQQFQKEVDAENASDTVTRGRRARGLPEVAVPYEEIKIVNRLDCSIDCNSGLGTCYRNAPPDQGKIKALRDKILASTTGSSIASEDLYKIFGIAGNACNRSDIGVAKNSRVIDDGDTCAYPMALKPADASPVAAIHIGHNVNGESIGGPKGASVIFNKPYAMPRLVFLQAALNHDYGGDILEMSADARGVYLNTTSNSCTFLGVAP